jgi:hypothetical protein
LQQLDIWTPLQLYVVWFVSVVFVSSLDADSAERQQKIALACYMRVRFFCWRWWPLVAMWDLTWAGKVHDVNPKRPHQRRSTNFGYDDEEIEILATAASR